MGRREYLLTLDSYLAGAWYCDGKKVCHQFPVSFPSLVLLLLSLMSLFFLLVWIMTIKRALKTGKLMPAGLLAGLLMLFLIEVFFCMQ